MFAYEFYLSGTCSNVHALCNGRELSIKLQCRTNNESTLVPGNLTRVKQKGYCSRVRDFRGSNRRKTFRGFLYLFVAQILEEIRGWGARDEHLLDL